MLAVFDGTKSRSYVGEDDETALMMSSIRGQSDRISGVRKSSSTPSFEDQDASSPSPIWHGLPKPISRWKNKAALD
ncbi:hypothetical protein CUMW_100480 [Citrus unshiu]|nr:hypothetical protein CUMW_100480 [Citrus unshiu]